MKSYNAEQVYRPQVVIEQSVESLGSVKAIAVRQERDKVTVDFNKDDGTTVFSAVIPEFKEGEPDAGVLGTELAKKILDAIEDIGDHIADDSHHLSDDERALLGESPTDASTMTVTFNTNPATAAETVMRSGDTLSDLMEDINANLKALDNRIPNNIPTSDTIYNTAKNYIDSKIPTITLPTTSITGFDDAVEDIATEVAQDVVSGVSSGTSTDNQWHVIEYRDGYCVCTKTMRYTVPINQTITNSTKQYCSAPTTVQHNFPFEFKDIPQLYLSVQHPQDISLSAFAQGIGVWALAVGKSSKTALPRIRLQCASTVATRTYNIDVRVEGYKKVTTSGG